MLLIFPSYHKCNFIFFTKDFLTYVIDNKCGNITADLNKLKNNQYKLFLNCS